MSSANENASLSLILSLISKNMHRYNAELGNMHFMYDLHVTICDKNSAISLRARFTPGGTKRFIGSQLLIRMLRCLTIRQNPIWESFNLSLLCTQSISLNMKYMSLSYA